MRRDRTIRRTTSGKCAPLGSRAVLPERVASAATGAAAASLLTGRAGRGALVPYGAFLAAGGIAALLL